MTIITEHTVITEINLFKIGLCVVCSLCGEVRASLIRYRASSIVNLVIGVSMLFITIISIWVSIHSNQVAQSQNFQVVIADPPVQFPENRSQVLGPKPVEGPKSVFLFVFS